MQPRGITVDKEIQPCKGGRMNPSSRPFRAGTFSYGGIPGLFALGFVLSHLRRLARNAEVGWLARAGHRFARVWRPKLRDVGEL